MQYDVAWEEIWRSNSTVPVLSSKLYLLYSQFTFIGDAIWLIFAVKFSDIIIETTLLKCQIILQITQLMVLTNQYIKVQLSSNDEFRVDKY